MINNDVTCSKCEDIVRDENSYERVSMVILENSPIIRNS